MTDVMILAGWIGSGVAGLSFIVWKRIDDFREISYAEMLMIVVIGGFFGPIVLVPIIIYYVMKLMFSDLLSGKPFKRRAASASGGDR